MTSSAKEKKERSRETIIELNQLGRQWIKAFLGVIKASKTHEANNDVFHQPIHILLETEARIIKIEEAFTLRLVGDQFFLNGVWIKPIIVERKQMFQLSDVFKLNDFGSISLNGNNTQETWRAFLLCYRDITSSAEKDTVRRLLDMLSQKAVTSITLEAFQNLKDQREFEIPLPIPAFAAVLSYAKCILSVKEFVSASSGEERATTLRKMQRAICDLVDLSIQTPRLCALLSLLKNSSNYYPHHGANTAILSILIARYLGASRSELADLAIAGLLQDSGMFQLPEELLTKPGELSPQEWEIIRTHPIRSAEALLELGYVNRSIIHRTLTIYTHHWVHGSEASSYPKTRRNLKPTIFTDILGLCLRYDALTSERPYQGTFEPWEAIRWLIREHEDKNIFRRDLMLIFVRFMGFVPMGSNVEFKEDGAKGIVAAGGFLSPKNQIPLIYVPEKNEWRQTLQNLRLKRRTSHAWEENVGVLFKNCENSELVNPASEIK